MCGGNRLSVNVTVSVLLVFSMFCMNGNGRTAVARGLVNFIIYYSVLILCVG